MFLKTLEVKNGRWSIWVRKIQVQLILGYCNTNQPTNQVLEIFYIESSAKFRQTSVHGMLYLHICVIIVNSFCIFWKRQLLKNILCVEMYLFLKIQGIFEVFSWWWLSWHILKKVAVCVWDVFLLDDPRCFWGIFFIILHILKVVAVGAWDVFLLDDPRYFRTIGKYFPADGPRNRNLLFATKDILYFLSPTFFSSKPCLFS